MSNETVSSIVEPLSRARARVREQRIAVLGAGTMGRALATGMTRHALASATQVRVADHSTARAEVLAADLGVTSAASNADACRDADVVLVCVKPKDVHGVLSDLVDRRALEHGPLLISIAAGVTIAAIESVVGADVPVVRAMPNTPCCIGHGMTALSAGRQATAAHMEIAREIFASVGRSLELDERHLDAVTAVSASGPAFIYLIVEALADGGVMCGLMRRTATELVAQMTLGAAAMVLSTGRHPAQLKDDVTTPGGCTIAGLLALEERHIRSALAHAVQTTTRVAAGLGR